MWRTRWTLISTSLPVSSPSFQTASKNSRLVFLGNIQPDLQRGVRAQVPNAELVALDTMNLWIDTTRESLQKTIEVVDLLIVNDAEARQLAEEPNLIKAARKDSLVGSAHADRKARRVWRGDVYARTNTSRFRPTLWKPSSIRPAPATPLPEV